LNACSAPKKSILPVIEAVKSVGLNITQIDSHLRETELDNVKPLAITSITMKIIRVYDFGSKAKQELGNKSI